MLDKESFELGRKSAYNDVLKYLKGTSEGDTSGCSDIDAEISFKYGESYIEGKADGVRWAIKELGGIPKA